MTKINISLQTLRGYYRGAELTHLVGPGGQHADGDSVADRGAQGCISYSLKEVTLLRPEFVSLQTGQNQNQE